MLKKYKNEIYLLLAKGNFQVPQFKLKNVETNTHNQQILSYKDSGMNFYIDQSPVSFHSFRVWYNKFEVGLPKVGPNPHADNKYFNFAQVKNILNSWLNNELLKYLDESGEPDFWKELSHSNEIFTLNEIKFNENENFDLEDRERLKLSLKEAELIIKDDAILSTVQVKILEDRINYLISAVDRMSNKMDWKSLAIGTIISMILNMGVDTQTGKQIWDVIKALFTTIKYLPS